MRRLCWLFVMGIPFLGWLPARAQSARQLQIVLPSVSASGELPVAGVLVSADSASRAELAVLSGKTPVWIAVSFPGPVETAVAQCVSSSCRGLALIFPDAKGEALPHDKLPPLLERKRCGEELAERVRSIRRKLSGDRKLAICAPAANIRPDTSRGLCIDVVALVRDGTVDAVLLSGQPSYNFHRLRLLRDQPLLAGVFVQTAGTRALCTDLAVATANPTAEAFWVWQNGKADVAQAIAATIAAAEEERRAQRRIADAIAAGTLATVLSVESSSGNNQATVHGVGQAFVPAAGGRCRAVQIYATLRGCREGLPEPLVVELRDDAGDKPGTMLLASGTIPAAAFGHEPAYRWGTAPLENASVLDPGRTYWIHLPNAKGYVWRMVGKGATNETHAWSHRYDYTEHSWILKVFVEVSKE